MAILTSNGWKTQKLLWSSDWKSGLPSTSATADVVHHDPDQHFRDHEILKFEYFENGES